MTTLRFALALPRLRSGASARLQTMPSLKDIRKRIRSVKNTQKITSAMKMVAAAKLKRAQEAISAARPYGNKLNEVVSELAQLGLTTPPRPALPILVKQHTRVKFVSEG